jgi:hypothetical protein
MENIPDGLKTEEILQLTIPQVSKKSVIQRQIKAGPLLILLFRPSLPLPISSIHMLPLSWYNSGTSLEISVFLS